MLTVGRFPHSISSLIAHCARRCRHDTPLRYPAARYAFTPIWKTSCERRSVGGKGGGGGQGRYTGHRPRSRSRRGWGPASGAKCTCCPLYEESKVRKELVFFEIPGGDDFVPYFLPRGTKSGGGVQKKKISKKDPQNSSIIDLFFEKSRFGPNFFASKGSPEDLIFQGFWYFFSLFQRFVWKFSAGNRTRPSNILLTPGREGVTDCP